MISKYPASLIPTEKLNYELAHRSLNPAFIFASIAILTFTFNFGNRYTSLGLVLVNLIRYIAGKKIITSAVYLPKMVFLLKSQIILNTILWNILTIPLMYESQGTGLTVFIMLIIMSSFAVGSSVSLGSDKKIAAFVQFGFQLPAGVLMLYFASQHDSADLYAISAAIFIELIYSLKQNSFTHNDIWSAILYEDFMMKSNAELKLSQTSLLKSNEELKVSQEKLAAETAKLVHTSRMASLGEMAGGIAHEVNNPLFIMQGHVEHLRRIASKMTEIELSEKISERADKLITTIQRVAQIVKGLRQFSQQSEGMPMEPVSLQKIAQDTLDFCQEKLKVNNFEIKASLESDAMVNCRGVQISQVIINLINNSFDAIQMDEMKWIELSIHQQDDFVYFKLRDSGKGLPEAVQAKLFQPFFTTKEVGKGTGLGLSISTGIIREHGGELYYDPTDSNTCFIIKLPIYKANQNAA